MLFLDLAKAYDSVEYWALEDAMRGIGIPENVLTVMRNLDERAQAKVLLGGRLSETGWVYLGRGAPQGEVMSPIRFIVWMNLLIEIIAEDESLGYQAEGVERKYAGQAYCDDGLFFAESLPELQKTCDIVSAFCEIYKVKINAGKSYYTVSRGEHRDKEMVAKWDELPRQKVMLWDHTANRNEGQWQDVQETNPGVAIRYLGVMITGNGDSTEQTSKVVKKVSGLLAYIEKSKCSAQLANYLLAACVGGTLNYYGPFTRHSHRTMGSTNTGDAPKQVRSAQRK